MRRGGGGGGGGLGDSSQRSRTGANRPRPGAEWGPGIRPAALDISHICPRRRSTCPRGPPHAPCCPALPAPLACSWPSWGYPGKETLQGRMGAEAVWGDAARGPQAGPPPPILLPSPRKEGGWLCVSKEL